MADDAGANALLAPGPLLRLGNARLRVTLAPQAGGRIAQVHFDGEPQLVGVDAAGGPAIAWGSYPMLPWAGRIRHGRFGFGGRQYALPPNLGEHAIHGLGFVSPWQVEAQATDHAELSLRLPEDARWPFGGLARQYIRVHGDALHLRLSLQAGAQAMPAALGWHPWFLKPDTLRFQPEAMYPRDSDGLAVLPLTAPRARPWDDCFINRQPVILQRGDLRLRLSSDCDHWVVYDQPAHATCVEPQTGPPDAPNLAPRVLAPGQALEAWFRWEWARDPSVP